MLVITRRDAVNIPWAFIAFLLWIGRNLPDFKSPKQALINAFNHYVCSSHLLDISLGAELQSKDSVSQWEKQMGDGVTGRSLFELQDGGAYRTFAERTIGRCAALATGRLKAYRTCRGRHYRTLVTLALGERWELTGGLVFLFPSDIGFVGYYLFRCFYILLCEISPLQGCFVLFPSVS